MDSRCVDFILFFEISDFPYMNRTFPWWGPGIATRCDFWCPRRLYRGTRRETSVSKAAFTITSPCHIIVIF